MLHSYSDNGQKERAVSEKFVPAKLPIMGNLRKKLVIFSKRNLNRGHSSEKLLPPQTLAAE
jgi:hypothetical protein